MTSNIKLLIMVFAIIYLIYGCVTLSLIINGYFLDLIQIPAYFSLLGLGFMYAAAFYRPVTRGCKSLYYDIRYKYPVFLRTYSTNDLTEIHRIHESGMIDFAIDYFYYNQLQIKLHFLNPDDLLTLKLASNLTGNFVSHKSKNGI